MNFLKVAIKANQDEINHYSAEIEKQQPSILRFFESFDPRMAVTIFSVVYHFGCFLA